MSKKSDHITNSEKEFLRYTGNKMSDKERNAFEKILQKDPFDAEALEGLSGLSPEEIKTDISDLKRGLFLKPRSSDRFTFYRYAAGLAVLITISSLFYFILNRKISGEQNPAILTESSEIRKDEKALSEPQKETITIQADRSPVVTANKPVTPEKNLSPKKERINSDIQPVLAEFHQSIDKSDDSVLLASDLQEKQEQPLQIEPAAVSNPLEQPLEKRLAVVNPSKSTRKAYSGRIISSEDFQPLPGASVVIKGTQSGTLTDSDGVFMLPPVPESDTSVTLRVAFIGMEEQEIPASAGKDLNIVMNPSELSLDEVVVVGYGSKRKNRTKESTGSVEGTPAEPLEGQKAFDDYISEHQNFPEKDSVISGVKVILEFLVDKSGQPYDIKVIMTYPVDTSGRPLNTKINAIQGKEFSDEAIRLLANGPKWRAASPASFKTRIIIALSKN